MDKPSTWRIFGEVEETGEQFSHDPTVDEETGLSQALRGKTVGDEGVRAVYNDQSVTIKIMGGSGIVSVQPGVAHFSRW